MVLFTMFAKLIFISLVFRSSADAVVAIVQDYYWRDYVPGSIPKDAFEGAAGRYVGQIHAPESLLPATIYPYNNTGVTLSYESNKLVVEKNVKILCGPNPRRFYWERVNFNQSHKDQLKDVVKGGFQFESYLFIGKVMDDGEWKIGQVFPLDHIYKGIWVWNSMGKGARYYEFDILKYDTSFIGGSCYN